MTKRRRGDAQLIPALARGEKVRDAARISGLSERTVHRRIKDIEFMTLVRQYRKELIEGSVGRLAEVSAKAVDTLETLLDAESESVRLGAARALLDQLPKLRETFELEQRLERLEWITREREEIRQRLINNG